MIHTSLRASLLCTVALAGILPLAANAQAITHYGSQTNIFVDSNVNAQYEGVAVDTSGNAYIADPGTNNVYKYTLSGGTYTQTTILNHATNGLTLPSGIAVDGSGNLYIADTSNERLLKETLSGGTYTQSVIAMNVAGSYLVNPYGVAVDSSGNVYVSAENYVASAYVSVVYKYTLSGGTYTQSSIGTGLNGAEGVAVDSSGNVYINDTNNVRVLKETLSGGTYTQSVVIDNTAFNWLNGINGLAVDSNGDVYIVNAGTGGYDAGTVAEATLSGGTYHMALVGTGIIAPWSVAVDPTGNIYVSGNFKYLTKISYPTTSFGTVNVGTTSAALSFPFTNTAYDRTISGVALSMDAAGEFVNTGTGTCDTNGMHLYAAGDTCTINVTFNPKFAGARNGIVELVNSAGVMIAEQYISGIGSGPQVAFAPGTVTTIGTSLTTPAAVAVDGNGNLFISDPGGNKIFQETPSGNSYTQTQLGLSAGTLLDGIAVDAAGNIYYAGAQTGAYTVYQGEPIAGNYQSNISANNPEGSALNTPQSLAADNAGNVYIADTANNRVVEELYSSGSTYNQPTTWQIPVATGLNGPLGVAVDGSGNVYIADTGNNRILKEAPAGGGTFTQSVAVSAGLSSPSGVAVDDIGNIYISDTGNARVLEETVSGGTYTQSVLIGTGLGSPKGLTLDASGNLYVADSGNKNIVKLNIATAPSLTFASTAIGATSSDSPQTVTLKNLGTTALTFPIPATGNDPSISANFSLNSTGGTACPLLTTSSSTVATLAANTTCTLPISFTPTASGTISGSLIVTDNNLNVSATTQTINLNGTGTAAAGATATLLPTPLAFGSVTVGQTSATMSATLTNTSSTTAITISSFTIGGTNPTDFAVTTGTNACGSTLAANSSCIVYVTFTPASATSFSAQLSVTDSATGSPQTVALTGTGTAPAVPIATLNPIQLTYPNTNIGSSSAAQTFTITNTGTGTLNLTSIALGGATPSDFTTSNNCGATLAAAAFCTVSVTFTPGFPRLSLASVLVTDNASGSPQSVVITGTGIAATPQATLSAPLPFAATNVGSSAPTQVIALANPGNATLTITSILISGTNASSFSTTTCGTTLAASATCLITIGFTPTASGPLSATLTVTDNATAGSTQTVALTGTGTAASVPQATLSPTTLNFPSTTVGVVASTQPITLSNPGTAALTITSISVTGTNAGSFGQTNNCGASLAAAASCTITVSFTPTSAAALTASVSVTDNATGSPQSVTLTGTGTAVLTPQATLAPSSLTFPSTTVGVAASTQPITLSNPGTAALTISGISITGTNAGSFGQTNNCGASLAAAASCTITVSFTPAAAGSLAASISVTDNATGSPQSITLAGTGVAVVSGSSTFTVATTTPTATVQPGGVAQYNLVIAPFGGTYNNLVTLSATGLPSGAQASFLPAAVTPGSAGAPSVMSIQTSTGLAHLDLPGQQRNSPVPLLAMLAGLPLLGFAGNLRRLRRCRGRWMLLGLATLAILPLLALSGCGGGYFGPAPKTYTVTVIGTSGVLQQSTTISLTVQ